MTNEIRFGIHVHLSQKCSARYPINDATNDTRQTMTMPTLTLTLSGFSEAIACPPTTADTREKPVTVAALRRSGIVARYNPKEYRAWTCCLSPVCGPPTAMKAGGIQTIREKNRITRAASRSLMPKTRVASMPVGILWPCQSYSFFESNGCILTAADTIDR
jgi:hypothetical protein